MKDLHPDWFSMPITGTDVFNLALNSVQLRLLRYEGTCCVIGSVCANRRLRDRDEQQLREIVQLFMMAAIKLGDELRLHNDFKLVDS